MVERRFVAPHIPVQLRVVSPLKVRLVAAYAVQPEENGKA
jgi:hypothetical protein